MMKIFVLGNINSGKSLFIEKLKPHLIGYDVFQIDSFRQKYGNYSLDGELLARRKFIEAVNTSKKCIVEFSGLGDIEKEIVRNRYIVFHVNVDKEVCINRLKYKDFSNIPYPKEFDQSIEQTINELDFQISSKFNNLWFDSALLFFNIKSECDVDNIPFNYIHDLESILDVLDGLDCKVISFGGLARKEITQYSDIDLFVISNQDPKDIKNYLQTKYKSITINQYKNKLYFTTSSNILIEIICISSLSEMKLLYSHSNIDSIPSTILKGNINIKDIKSINKVDNYAELKETLEWLQYTLELMEHILSPDDTYKFWLNSSIVSSCIFKIKYIIVNNNFKHFYLPKKTEEYFSRDELKIIFYEYGTDKKQYLISIKSFINNLLKELYNKLKL